MSLSIKSSTKGLEELQKYFEDITERTEDLRPIERELGDIQREELKLRFLSSPATEVGGVVHGGAYWNRLSDFYLSMVPRRRGKQIMIDTQKLKMDSTLDGPGNNSEFRGSEYEFTINTSYAAEQNSMRELLFWSETLLDKTTEKVINYILTGETREV